MAIIHAINHNPQHLRTHDRVYKRKAIAKTVVTPRFKTTHNSLNQQPAFFNLKNEITKEQWIASLPKNCVYVGIESLHLDNGDIVEIADYTPHSKQKLYMKALASLLVVYMLSILTLSLFTY